MENDSIYTVKQDVPHDSGLFYTVNDVSNILGVSTSTAYREIKKLNDELKKNGFITISGKVPIKFFRERLYC